MALAANLLLLILVSLALAANSADVSNTVCQRTTHKHVCLSIVRSDRRASLKTSPNGIAAILRDGGVARAVSTKARISSLLKTATGSHEKASLRACSAGYSRAIPSLRSADFGVINSGTYGSLIAAVSDAGDEPRDCELTFQEPPAVSSPISAENQRLRDICATTLEVVNIVVCNSPSFC